MDCLPRNDQDLTGDKLGKVVCVCSEVQLLFQEGLEPSWEIQVSSSCCFYTLYSEQCADYLIPFQRRIGMDGWEGEFLDT
jgi:hypothetical protein